MQTTRKYNKKYKLTKTLKDSYKTYKKDNPKGVSAKIFVSICKKFNKKVIDKIVYQSFEFRIPHQLGFIRVKKCVTTIEVTEDGKLNTTRLKPDWKACWEYWYKIYPGKTRQEIVDIPDKKLIYHYNDDTDGFYYKFYWDRRVSNVRNQSLYKFRPTMGVKQILKDRLRNEDYTNDYYE